MGIRVHCDGCGATFAVKDELAGRKGKCAKCGAMLQVPSLPQAQQKQATQRAAQNEVTAATATSERSPAKQAERRTDAAVPQLPGREQVLAAISGPIKPVRTSFFYQVGLLWAAIVMVIMPLVYMAVIALAAWAVYYHAVNHVGMLTAVRGRGMILMLALYAAPIVAGGIMVLFMIKPLFAPPAEEGRTRSLTRQGEPLLFDFVDKLCESVGAPQPNRIQVDAQVNASASYGSGWKGLFSRDLTLTIGVPLAAGLSLNQFSGVLAHEFGHFSQGMGMRLTYIVRSISHWFVRVVYHRDAWDAWLAEAHEDTEWYVALIILLAQFCVFLSRCVLWVLMYLGFFVAGFLLRQMEYDADLHETRFAGSETFESTSFRLRTLGASYGAVMNELVRNLTRGNDLPDDLAKMVLARADQLPPEVSKKLRKSFEEESTGMFDTHPCDKQRIAAARQEDSPGVFHCDGPASLLFKNFETLCQNVTGDFYRGIFGIRFNAKALKPTDAILAESNA